MFWVVVETVQQLMCHICGFEKHSCVCVCEVPGPCGT